MSDLYDDREDEPLAPEDLCRQAFSRCSNWPEDRLGQIGLAQGLARAASQFHISQEDIIARCAELSAFCPTDADLLRVSGEMDTARRETAEAARDKRREWEREYGKPDPVDTSLSGKCRCCDRDWSEIIRTANDRRTKLWSGLREYFQVKNGQWPTYREMAPIARKLGFPEYAEGWERQ